MEKMHQTLVQLLNKGEDLSFTEDADYSKTSHKSFTMRLHFKMNLMLASRLSEDKRRVDVALRNT